MWFKRRSPRHIRRSGTRHGCPRGDLIPARGGTSPIGGSVTVFGHVLAQGRPLDVLIAGDDARAKASVSAFIESLGLRPLDPGDLAMAHWLGGVAPLLMGLPRHGAGFNIDLGLNVSG